MADKTGTCPFRFYRESNGDYLCVDTSTRDYYRGMGRNELEGRAAALGGNVGSVQTTSVSLDFLRGCTRVYRADVPAEWLEAFGVELPAYGTPYGVYHEQAHVAGPRGGVTGTGGYIKGVKGLPQVFTREEAENYARRAHKMNARLTGHRWTAQEMEAGVLGYVRSSGGNVPG